MPNDLIVGAWRNGLADPTVIATVEKRRKAGFRALAYESTVLELIDLLDSYEEFVADQLVCDECACESE